MTIAEKITTIASNMSDVYDAGYVEGYAAGHVGGIAIRTVGFDSWHSGTDASQFIPFEHGLGSRPRFVAMVADDPSALDTLDLAAENTSAVIYESDAFYNEDGVCYLLSAIRRKSGETTTGISTAEPGSNRLISKMDDTYIYVNAASSSYKWAPSRITTYTMVCII